MRIIFHSLKLIDFMFKTFLVFKNYTKMSRDETRPNIWFNKIYFIIFKVNLSKFINYAKSNNR